THAPNGALAVMNRTLRLPLTALVASLLTVGLAPDAGAQDRLKSMPGYDQYQKMSRQIFGSVKMGTLPVTWQDGGKTFEDQKDGKKYRYDIEHKEPVEVKAQAPPATTAETPARPPAGRRRGSRVGMGPPPERGRQYTQATSPDGTLKA